jgi:hypothetical protein
MAIAQLSLGLGNWNSLVMRIVNMYTMSVNETATQNLRQHHFLQPVGRVRAVGHMYPQR